MLNLVVLNKEIPVVIAFTPNYIIPACTTIFSILENSDTTDRFEVICLLTEDVSDDVKKILEVWDNTRLDFVFLNLSDKLNGVYIDERYTAAASYRLLLPDILIQYDTVIYLDCDIIVRNNIANLYKEIDIRTYYLAAVTEASLDFQIPYLNSIGCVAGNYFNSGFLIMNLAMMRNDNISSQLIEKSNNPNLSFPDQDALNIVCGGKVLKLDPMYNSIRTFFLQQYKNEFLRYYSESDWENVQNNGTIHYTGSKPWNGYAVKFEVWWNYYSKLPKSIQSLGTINSNLFFLSKLFHFSIFKFCFRVLQSVLRGFKSV